MERTEHERATWLLDDLVEDPRGFTAKQWKELKHVIKTLLADSERCERLEGLDWGLIKHLAVKEGAYDGGKLYLEICAALEVPDGE